MKKGQKIKSDSPHKNQACHDWRGCKLKILITQYKTALMFNGSCPLKLGYYIEPSVWLYVTQLVKRLALIRPGIYNLQLNLDFT